MKTSDALDRRRAEVVLLVRALEAEMAAIAESTAQSPDDEHDPEGSTIGFERARVDALLTGARRSLHDLEHAVERSQRGDYGICERCGTAIAEERLETLPTTTWCANCA